MTQLPPVTPALVRRFEAVMADLNLAATRNLERLPGNPFGCEIRSWDEGQARRAGRATGPGWWNRARGFEEAADATLDEAISFMNETCQPWFLDSAPGLFTPAYGRRLVERGLYPYEFATVVYGLAQLPGKVDTTGMRLCEISPNEVDLLAELWAEGFGFPPGAERDTARNIRRGWFTLPDNHCYLAYVDEQPAAMAALYVRDGIGFLNVGATLPAYRRRGCHAALTLRRIGDAAAAGCELVIGHTGFGGQSQNNEERLGLRIAYTPCSWAARI